MRNELCFTCNKNPTNDQLIMKDGLPELPSSTELPYFIRKSVINTEVRIPVIKYGNMKIQTCVYIAATVANILHALRASFNS